MEQQLRDITLGVLREVGAPGASVALLVDGEPYFVAGVGSRDLDGATPLGDDAELYIYSVTKLLIAAALLQLVGEGAVGLDVPVQEYLPDLPLAVPITVRRVLNHTGGLPDYGALPAYNAALRADPARPWTDAEFLARTLPLGLRFPPGEGWAYSNVGFLIARLILERVTGLTLRQALHERIFAPCGARRSGVVETLADTARLSPGYSTFLRPGEPPADVSRTYHPGWVSHGVAGATASDLARVVGAICTGELLREDLLGALLDPVPVGGAHPPFRRPSYGLGAMIDPASPYGHIAGHNGGGPGYSASAFHCPDVAGRAVTVAVLLNRDGPDPAQRIAFALVAALAEARG